MIQLRHPSRATCTGGGKERMKSDEMGVVMQLRSRCSGTMLLESAVTWTFWGGRGDPA